VGLGGARDTRGFRLRAAQRIFTPRAPLERLVARILSRKRMTPLGSGIGHPEFKKEYLARRAGNRAEKYFDGKMFPTLRFGFRFERNAGRPLLREGLELVANRERYSIARLLGTLPCSEPEFDAQKTARAGRRRLLFRVLSGC